jgi:hypothetical protein
MNNVGGGARFEITLPVETPADAAPEDEDGHRDTSR